MTHDRDRTSIATPVVLLWIFMSVPRLWYLGRAGLPPNTTFWSGGIAPLILGGFRDGLFAGLIFLPI